MSNTFKSFCSKFFLLKFNSCISGLISTPESVSSNIYYQRVNDFLSQVFAVSTTFRSFKIIDFEQQAARRKFYNFLLFNIFQAFQHGGFPGTKLSTVVVTLVGKRMGWREKRI